MEQKIGKTIEQLSFEFFSTLKGRFGTDNKEQFGEIDQSLYFIADILKAFKGHDPKVIEAAISFISFFPERFNTANKCLFYVGEITTKIEESCKNTESLNTSLSVFKYMLDNFCSSYYFEHEGLSDSLLKLIIEMFESDNPFWLQFMLRK